MKGIRFLAIWRALQVRLSSAVTSPTSSCLEEVLERGGDRLESKGACMRGEVSARVHFIPSRVWAEGRGEGEGGRVRRLRFAACERSTVQRGELE